MAAEWTRDGFTVSDDPARLQLDVIHGFLTTAYWSEGVARETVERAIAHSLPFGLYAGATQIGFARAVTDRATYAYMADVFVLPEWRGRGLSKFLVECMLAHPELQGLRRWVLRTRDAHGLYAQFGFGPIQQTERWMQR
ncbi:MAG: GNAT family N-acetyltransferase [Candidatus Eisenbacteria bacterium]